MQIFLVIFQICLFPKTLSCCLCTPMQMFLQYFSFAYFHGVSFCLFQSMGRQGLSAFMHQGIWSSAKLLPCLEFKIGFTWKSCLRPLKVEVHRSTISTDDFHWETILKLLSIWFLQWNPCLYNLGPIIHILRWLKSTYISHGGKQYESKGANGEDYFVFKRQDWWSDVSGVRMTWASIGISSSEPVTGYSSSASSSSSSSSCATDIQYKSLVFSKTHRWMCIQIRSSGRTRAFASSAESPIFCFPI